MNELSCTAEPAMCRIPDELEPDQTAPNQSTSSTSAVHKESLPAQTGDPGRAASESVGTEALVAGRRSRDLSQLFPNATPAVPECSPDQGESAIEEADAKSPSPQTNYVPNTAATSCNEGKSYCDSEGNRVQDTLQEENRRREQYDLDAATRAAQSAPEADATDAARGTLSIAGGVGGCIPGACASISGELTVGANGSVALSVGGNGASGFSAERTADASIAVKLTDARDASQVATGLETNVGVQVGNTSVDYVRGRGYEGAVVGFHSTPSVGVHVGTTQSFGVELAEGK